VRYGRAEPLVENGELRMKSEVMMKNWGKNPGVRI
jgi:hypothetical protein